MRLAFYFLVGLLLGGGCTYAVSADYAVATLASYHFDRSKPHNERNFGLGYEHRASLEWAVSAGFYRNSFDRHTNYALVGYAPFSLGQWRVGATFGLASGYNSPVLAALVATRDWGRFGVNIAMAPTAVAMQVKWRLR